MRARPLSLALAAGAFASAGLLAAAPVPALAAAHHPRHHRHRHHAVRPATVSLTVTNTVGDPAIALAGVRLVVRGTVAPFVRGQKVVVRFYRDKRKLLARRLAVRSMHNGTGFFEIGFTSGRTGLLSIHATHYATRRQEKAAAEGVYLRVANPNLQPGASGPVVTALQQSLANLHFAVAQTGVYDLSTEQALIAYCRVTGQPLATSVNGTLFGMIAQGEGAFAVHDPQDGRHFEGDLSRQLLAEIDPGGRVERIYMISSGKPSTPTVVGHFAVYLKTLGVNAKGMVDANYFVGGYAIHGYADVPTYPASHGCLRIPIPDAPAVYQWATIGTPVDVYYESGGGSTTVSSTVGA